MPGDGGFCSDARREREVLGKGAPRQVAAQAAWGRVWLAIPEARGDRGNGRRCIGEDTSRQQGHPGQALAGFGGVDELPGGPHHPLDGEG